MAARSSEKLSPTEEALRLAPEGRKPYVRVRLFLDNGPEHFRHRYPEQADILTELAEANREGVLEPPLGKKLTKAVVKAEDQYADSLSLRHAHVDWTTTVLAGSPITEASAAVDALFQAVYERGYSRED